MADWSRLPWGDEAAADRRPQPLRPWGVAVPGRHRTELSHVKLPAFQRPHQRVHVAVVPAEAIRVDELVAAGTRCAPSDKRDSVAGGTAH